MMAREGIAPLLTALIAGLVVLHYLGVVYSLPVWLLAVLIFALFRDPEREIPSQPLAVVSPADGTITAAVSDLDPYLQRQSIHVTIRMLPYSVFTIRSPIEGKALEPPDLPEDKIAPHGVWLQTDEGDDVVMVMHHGRIKNAPRCYVRFGERTGQGQRCGFVHLGSTIDLYLPENSRLMIKEGDKVVAGSDVIAKLVRT